MAGQGTCVGGDFAHFTDILDKANWHPRIGLCIDTCHVFAAGYGPALVGRVRAARRCGGQARRPFRACAAGTSQRQQGREGDAPRPPRASRRGRDRASPLRAADERPNASKRRRRYSRRRRKASATKATSHFCGRCADSSAARRRAFFFCSASRRSCAIIAERYSREGCAVGFLQPALAGLPGHTHSRFPHIQNPASARRHAGDAAYPRSYDNRPYRRGGEPARPSQPFEHHGPHDRRPSSSSYRYCSSRSCAVCSKSSARAICGRSAAARRR